MAQALFDEHPLEQYLRAAGEPPEIMPGSAPEFVEDYHYEELDDEEAEAEWRPDLLVQLVELVKSVFTPPPQSSLFAERFKYDVISSSLLSTTLPVPNAHRRSISPSLPGKLKLDIPPSNPPHLLLDFRLLSLLCGLAALFLATGLYFFAIVALGGAAIYLYNHSDNAKPDSSSTTMEALTELITANAQWDSVVQDTVTLLEKEEESPPSPVSGIRLSLHSSLHTTQTQCDNVRHLVAALTAPLEAAQLAEMYAPPSPRHSLILPASPTPFPESRDRDKRSTWAGAPPGMHVLKNRDRRRSDLSSILPLGMSLPGSSSHSAPTTPRLGDVQEEGAESESRQPFGPAALDLHRRRRVSGVETLGLRLHPQSGNTYTPPRTPQSGSSTVSHASRFTTMQSVRHPLALSALYHALDGALASKRYACSHLLALRFGDLDDEGYWEDVRSVMELLTSTFADTAARLEAALADAHRQQEAEFDIALDPVPSRAEPPLENPPPRTTGSMLSSFAPVPTHLTRFAAHVDAISSALDDARDHLAECVAALREKSPAPELRRRRSRTFSLSRLGGGGSAADVQPPAEPLALQAYERLRRELGLALRECERGRDRLLDIVSPPAPAETAAESEEEGVPSLGHDGSDECDEASSDRPEEATSLEDQHRDSVVVAPGDGVEVDDATAHLLHGASALHLPLPGAEQVFESDAEVGLFTRERSKLTREERIKLAKERREAGARLSVPKADASEELPLEREKWGLGGEVVQELKDVIWKVGERRRKMASMS